jgi:hypothetical protein
MYDQTLTSPISQMNKMMSSFSNPSFLGLQSRSNSHHSIDLRQCNTYALYFKGLRTHGWILSLLFVCLFLGSLWLTICTRNLQDGGVTAPASEVRTTAPVISTVPGEDSDGGVGEESVLPAPQDTATSSRQLETAVADIEAQGPSGDDMPPPYQPQSSSSLSAAVPQPDSPPSAVPTTNRSSLPRRSSAHLFVLGTFYMILNILALFNLALTIQSILFCVWGPLHHTPTSVFYWLIFSIPTAFATVGGAVWAMLFRDLFGPKAKKRWAFRETVVLEVTAYALGSPVILLMIIGMLVGTGVIKGLEGCQRRWCPDSLAEEEAEAELTTSDGRTVVELEMGSVDASFIPTEEEIGDLDMNGSGSGDGSRDEERVGLISSAKK